MICLDVLLAFGGSWIEPLRRWAAAALPGLGPSAWVSRQIACPATAGTFAAYLVAGGDVSDLVFPEQGARAHRGDRESGAICGDL